VGNLTKLTNPRALAHAHTTSFVENREDDMADEKPNEKPDEMTDAARLRDWMESVGGNVYPGASTLKSVKESEDGDKITIVLKRTKEKREKKEKEKSDQALNALMAGLRS
jgi:hypothetical protein